MTKGDHSEYLFASVAGKPSIAQRIFSYMPAAKHCVTNPYVSNLQRNLVVVDAWQLRFVSRKWRHLVDSETKLTLYWDPKSCSLPPCSEPEFSLYRRSPQGSPQGFLRQRFTPDSMPPADLLQCIDQLHLVLYDIPSRSQSISTVIKNLVSALKHNTKVIIELGEKTGCREPLSPTYSYATPWEFFMKDFSQAYPSLRLDSLSMKQCYHLYSQALLGSDEQARLLRYFFAPTMTSLSNVNTFVFNEAVNLLPRNCRLTDLKSLEVAVGPIAEAECLIGPVNVIAAFHKSFPNVQRFPNLVSLKLVEVRLPIDCSIFADLQRLETYELSIASKHAAEVARVIKESRFSIDSKQIKNYTVDVSPYYDAYVGSRTSNENIFAVGFGVVNLVIRNFSAEVAEEATKAAKAGRFRCLKSLTIEMVNGEPGTSAPSCDEKLESLLTTLNTYASKLQDLRIVDHSDKSSRRSSLQSSPGDVWLLSSLPESVTTCSLDEVLDPPSVENALVYTTSVKEAGVVFQELMKAWILNIIRSVNGTNIRTISISAARTSGYNRSEPDLQFLIDQSAILTNLIAWFQVNNELTLSDFTGSIFLAKTERSPSSTSTKSEHCLQFELMETNQQACGAVRKCCINLNLQSSSECSSRRDSYSFYETFEESCLETPILEYIE